MQVEGIAPATRTYQRRRPKKPGGVMKLVSNVNAQHNKQVDPDSDENTPNSATPTLTTTCTSSSPERVGLKRKLTRDKDKDEPKCSEKKARRTLPFATTEEKVAGEPMTTTCAKCGMVYLTEGHKPSKGNRKVTAAMHSRYCSGVTKGNTNIINFPVPKSFTKDEISLLCS